ncbi:hypothetical protein U2237_11010 [Pseudomonas syringae pv. tomato]|uniref:hypothetical protein n=1 Tax=Pseudomonas syringae group TaxID=136849 RepID=UPI001067B3DD|nr:MULTISPECIES: hypothetical protein [Pseudomonas syringae group]MBM1212554.1 hypothetical protein [Pseudomonas syringae]MBM1218294.1 hypothetical protein [Pseudomonas syringae]MBX6434667.1 hypothetical protein [Pseudomonas syringae pv. tomato]MBX6467030.1 hypothetical protein [Pseudomonas syringae pv. tomato]MBX6482378.1 hypothetical protein [Pseudomonas syringae pv. tomato]
MTDFITVADVDAQLGPAWAGTGDPVLAVTMANAWLTAKIKRVVPDPTPVEIKTAGAQVAKEAAAGNLYKATQKEVQSKTVSAQSGTSVSKTYVAGSSDMSQGENFAIALLAPWFKRSGTIMLKRI